MIRLLTHTDLDGVGCAVVMRHVHPDAGCELVENGAIDARVREVIAGAGPEVVWVTDHGLDEATARLVDAFVRDGGSFRLLDHHRSSMHLAGRTWARVDEGSSATGLLFDALGRPPELAEFAALVEDHDMWRHADPRSERLAALAGLLGHERFLARFAANPSVAFDEPESLLLERAGAERDEYLAKKVAQARVTEIGGRRWAVCYAEQMQSDLAERLMNELGVDATALVNPAKRTVSLRGRGVDVAALAARFGGGGHGRAAAFSFRGGELERALEAFESLLETRLG